MVVFKVAFKWDLAARGLIISMLAAQNLPQKLTVLYGKVLHLSFENCAKHSPFHSEMTYSGLLLAQISQEIDSSIGLLSS